MGFFLIRTFNPWFFIAVLSVVINGCKTELVNPLSPKCIGHGGMGIESLQPMNSKSSVLKCLELGADGVEMDIQMSNDNVLFAFHDADLDNTSLTEGTINDYLATSIESCTLNGLLNGNEKIERLDSMFNWLDHFPNATVTLDIKLYSKQPYTTYIQSFAKTLHQFLEDHPRKHRVLIESQDTSFLNLLHLLSPNAEVYYYTSNFQDGLAAVTKFNYSGLTMDHKNVTKHEVDSLHAKNYKISVWNVKTSKQNREAIQLTPDYIQSDEVRDLLQKIKPK